MKFSENTIGIFKVISLLSGLFTVLIGITMIFSVIQLKTFDPINTPAMQTIKEQFDRDPENMDKAGQVRTLDLMARRAYFSTRWQVEAGSYLLLAGALVFVVLQRLVAGNEKPARNLRSDKPDIVSERARNRKYLVISAGVIIVAAIISSFVMRSAMPSQGGSDGTVKTAKVTSGPINEDTGDKNYPFFRGAGSRGIAGGKDYPTEWNGPENKNIKWMLPVPQPGKSSPVIWGDKLFITGAGNGEFTLFCIDKNKGEILWKGSAKGFPGSSDEEPESDAEAGMAVPTAAVCKEGVYAIFGNGNLVAYDFDGRLMWAKNVGVPRVTYAYSSSLVIYEGILIVQYDTPEKLSVMGFDIKTGDLKWETPRPGRAVNSSPVLAVFDGQPQVLINGNPGVSSYDPVTGRELWTLPGVSGDVAPSVAANSKMVFTAVDYYKVIALRPGKNGSTVWEDNSYTPDVSSPAANDKFLFVATGSGDVACYNAEKGDTLWTQFIKNPVYASPVICDNKVWILDRNGIMHIAEASETKKIISLNPLGESADCTPAFSEGKIYIRGKDNLYCIASK